MPERIYSQHHRRARTQLNALESSSMAFVAVAIAIATLFPRMCRFGSGWRREVLRTVMHDALFFSILSIALVYSYSISSYNLYYIDSIY